MSELLGSKPLMESSAAEPSAASEPSSNVVFDSEVIGQSGESTAVVSDYFDTVDGEPIDFSKCLQEETRSIQEGIRRG